MSTSSAASDFGHSRMLSRLKSFVLSHFERILVITILAVVTASHFWFARGIPILFFYFLPALVAGYVLGKRNALLIAVFSVLVVAFTFVVDSSAFVPKHDTSSNLLVATDLAAWAGFLILAALVTGQLYEDKERRIQELRSAYLGILQVLARYLDNPEGPTKGHCLRVATLSAEMSLAMGLPSSTVDNVRAAALLHDIEMSGEGISGDMIHRAAMLSEDQQALKTPDSKSGEILTSVGTVLKGAIPLIRYRCEHTDDGNDPMAVNPAEIPLGARIVAVADAYDELTTDKPYVTGRAPWVAVKEIEKGIGTRYDRAVVEALKSVVAHRLEQDERVMALSSI